MHKKRIEKFNINLTKFVVVSRNFSKKKLLMKFEQVTQMHKIYAYIFKNLITNQIYVKYDGVSFSYHQSQNNIHSSNIILNDEAWNIRFRSWMIKPFPHIMEVRKWQGSLWWICWQRILFIIVLNFWKVHQYWWIVYWIYWSRIVSFSIWNHECLLFCISENRSWCYYYIQSGELIWQSKFNVLRINL